ncbi:MAG: hypothetical protein PHF29_04655 [Candidatus Riflebacteria bacterium]|nr:hypothetical protein [Candidatus Riflebacteria bacterium]
MFEIFNNTLILCSVKNRIIFNNLRSRTGLGKAIAFLFVLLACVWAVSDFSIEISGKILAMPFGYDINLLFFALIVMFVLFITFMGDLTTGHTINMGQMGSDFEYLQTLPVKPINIIILKLYERLINDYFGILVMLSAFVGISCRDGCSLTKIAIAIFLYLEFSLFSGLAINLMMIVFTRFFKKSTINNIFSVIGYLSAFLILVPFLLLDAYPQRFIAKVVSLYSNAETLIDTLFMPFLWVADCLVNKTFTVSFWYFSLFWAAIMLVGCLIYSTALKHIWFSYSYYGKKSSKNHGNNSFFKGIISKEFNMLKSDYNLLINSLLLPFTVIAAEIYVMKTVFSFTTVYSVMSLIFGAIIYFCMFGPVNSVGYEGKAVALIETLPITAAEFIRQKFYFWLCIAQICFLPATIFALRYLGFTYKVVMQSTLITVIFTACCVFLSVCVSAIYANYEAKVISQKSTFLGKIVALLVMLSASPIKYLNLMNALSFILFIVLTALMWFKAVHLLENRLDANELYNSKMRRADVIMVLVAYFATVVAVYQFVEALVPGLEIGHWPWSIALICVGPVAVAVVGPINAKQN